MINRRTRSLLLWAAALAAAGCATSAPFQRMVAHVVPSVSAAAARYVNADVSLDPATKAGRLADVSALRSSAATTQGVTDQGVYSAWARVSPWYRAYVLADPRLTPDERADRIGRADKLDANIAAEAHRPFGAGTRPAE